LPLLLDSITIFLLRPRLEIIFITLDSLAGGNYFHFVFRL